MKLVQNSGTDRVIDYLRSKLTAGCQFDIVTSSFSLFAFSGMLQEMAALVTCRLLLPSTITELSVLGSEADRAARNRLQNRWIASRLLQWLQSKSEVKLAPGAVPQGAFVVRDGDAPTSASQFTRCRASRRRGLVGGDVGRGRSGGPGWGGRTGGDGGGGRYQPRWSSGPTDGRYGRGHPRCSGRAGGSHLVTVVGIRGDFRCRSGSLPGYGRCARMVVSGGARQRASGRATR